jgi:hypothetical protein
MREWGNDLNKILDHLSDWTQQKTLECMREEWGKEEVCDEFAVVCKITIMKKIVFHSDFLTKAILGSTYPGVYSRAMDMWIRALENETIPSVWLLGNHWLCDKEDRAHILTMNERMDRLVASWGPKSHKFGAVTTEDGRTIPLKDLHGIEKGWAVSVAEIARYRVAVISRVSLLMSSFPTASNPGSHTDFGEVAQLRQMMNHTINAKSQQVADALEEHVDQKLGSRLVDMERRLSHFEGVNKGLVVMTATENAQAMLGRIDEKFQALKATGFPQLEERFNILEASLESLRPTGPAEGSKNTAEFEDLSAVVHAMRDNLKDLSSRSYAADGEPFVVIRRNSGRGWMMLNGQLGSWEILARRLRAYKANVRA